MDGVGDSVVGPREGSEVRGIGFVMAAGIATIEASPNEHSLN
jgi:hypothetical protein